MATGWSTDPTKHQQIWYEALSSIDYDEYEPHTSEGLEILRRKIGFAMYGLPEEEPSHSNGQTGYSEKQFEVIKCVADFLVEVNKEKEHGNVDRLYMAIIFVYMDFENQLQQFPVFRLRCYDRICKFVDLNCRVYLSWKSFLEENELPPGKLCWPLDGVYSGDGQGIVRLGWGVTPAATPERQLLNKVDRVSTVSALGTSAVFLTALVAPVAAPVMAVAGACAAATGAYSALRSLGTLADRSNHGQTVNPLRDRQAAASWICVAGSTAGFASGRMMSRAANLARNGEVMGTAGRFTCNALNVTSLAVNATGVGFGAFCMGERLKEGELTALDVFQFSASVLFFTHATVNFKTASSIIQDTQKDVLQDFKDSLRSNRHRKQFNKLAKNTAAGANNVMDGNAKVIRSIRNIDNKDDFFAGMVRTRKVLSGHKVTFSGNGNIIVDGGAEIHPMRLYELGIHQRQEFLSMARQAAQGSMSEASLMSGLQSAVQSTASSSSDNTSTKTSDTTCALNALSTQLSQSFPGSNIGTNEVMLVVMVVNELTTRLCRGKNQAKWWNLVWKHFINLVREMLDAYEEGKQIAIELQEFVDERSFNLGQGIRMTNVFVYYVINTFERLRDHCEGLARAIREEGDNDDSNNFPLL